MHSYNENNYALGEKGIPMMKIMMLIGEKRVSYAFNDFLCIGSPSKVRRVTFCLISHNVRKKWACFKGNCLGLNSRKLLQNQADVYGQNEYKYENSKALGKISV